MATEAQARLARVQRAYMKAKAAGDAEAADALAAEAQRLQVATSVDRSEALRQQQEADRERYSPTAGSSFGRNLVEGYGRGTASVIRALGGESLLEKFGLPGTEEAKRLDEPLLNTGGGAIGNALGVTAPAIPLAMATPLTATGGATAATAAGARLAPNLVRARTFAAPTTLAGRAANVAAPQALSGLAAGAALTEGDLGDRAAAAGMGAGFGVLGSAIPTVWQTGKALASGLVEPLHASGRDRIVGRLLDRFSEAPGGLVGLSDAPTVTGARLTTPEAARDPGLERLSRVIQNIEPTTTGRVRARAEANNRARLSALEELAGRGGKREFFEANRDATTAPMLEAADRIGFNYSAMSPDDLEFMGKLAGRIPTSLRSEAAEMAKIRGVDTVPVAGDPGDPSGYFRGFQFLKAALDDRISKELLRNPESRMGAALTGLKGDILGAVDNFNPEYRNWRQTYEAMSRPINQMDVGQRLLDTATSSTRNLAGDYTAQVGNFGRALKNEEQLVGLATGRRQKLADLMDPDQMQLLEGVRGELETLAGLSSWANGPGSQTARLLASENLARRIAGPMGLDDSFLNGSIADTLTGLTKYPYAWTGAENKLAQRAGDALLEPASASSFVAKARAYDAPKPSTRKGRAARRSIGAAAGTGSAALVDE